VAEELRLMIVIKSALKHRSRRDVIRKTWGYDRRFADVNIRHAFVVGSCDSITLVEAEEMIGERSPYGRRGHPTSASHVTGPPKCQDLLDEEQELNKDIIQADFLDTYYNNTIKTMVGMKWVLDHCPTAEFVLFVDDDYYVSIKNLLKDLNNPFAATSKNMDKLNGRDALDTFDAKKFAPGGPFDGRLYMGYVFGDSAPMRHKTSKWYVPLEEYKYDKFPPYVTAGAFVLSRESLRDMFYASLYTRHFRFDDIYLGILAKRVQLKPFHNMNFHFHKKYPQTVGHYRDVIASHGFDDSHEMYKLWTDEKEAGYA